MGKKKQTIDELLEEALVPEEEQPFEVPSNWIWIRLKTINKNKNKNIDLKKFEDEYFELYSVPSFATDEPEYVKGQEIGSSKQLVEEQDVLLCKINPRINRVWIVGDNQKKYRQIASTEWIVICKNKVVHPKYLLFLLRSPYFRKLLTSNVSGVGGSLTRARPKEVDAYPIALPPLNEQKRIAEKVERLLEKIEEAKTLIEEGKETFELRRAAILDKAFHGELTRKWRKEKNTTDNVSKLSFVSAEAPYPVPQSWMWITLEDGCEKITDGTHHSPKSYPTGDYMYITAKNIKENGILLDNVTYVSKEVHEEIYSRCDVKKGDVLYIKDGATTGVATVNQLSEEFSLLSSVGLLRPKKDVLLPEYLMFCLNSPTTKGRMLGMMSGNAIRRLTLKKIKQGIIPLPPIDEQRVIISILDKVKDIDEKLNWYSNVEQNIEFLKQSVLSKAFGGELGTNDSTEESAIELLKEVLQEKIK